MQYRTLVDSCIRSMCWTHQQEDHLGVGHSNYDDRDGGVSCELLCVDPSVLRGLVDQLGDRIRLADKRPHNSKQRRPEEAPVDPWFSDTV